MHPQPKYKNSAAFYDVDGTLIKINIVHAFAFYASRHASIAESTRRTIQTGILTPRCVARFALTLCAGLERVR